MDIYFIKNELAKFIKYYVDKHLKETGYMPDIYNLECAAKEYFFDNFVLFGLQNLDVTINTYNSDEIEFTVCISAARKVVLNRSK